MLLNDKAHSVPPLQLSHLETSPLLLTTENRSQRVETLQVGQVYNSICYFPLCYNKILDKSGWGRKGLLWLTTQGHSPPRWIRHGRRCMMYHVWSHPQLGSRERWILMFNLLFPLYSIWDSGLQNCTTYIQDGISHPDEPSLETILQTRPKVHCSFPR